MRLMTSYFFFSSATFCFNATNVFGNETSLNCTLVLTDIYHDDVPV